MLANKKKRPSSFGSDGRRLHGGVSSRGGGVRNQSVGSKIVGVMSTTGTFPSITTSASSTTTSMTHTSSSTQCGSLGQKQQQRQQHQLPKTNALFRPGTKICIQRAPVLNCLSVSSGLHKKFQRPMTKRRAYNKTAEEALKKSSLGVKRRMDGMSKLLARAGKGLLFKLPTQLNSNPDATDASSDDSDNDDDQQQGNNQPIEPLLLWTSPHQGAKPNGLPPTLVIEVQTDEAGIEEHVTVLKPALVESYSTQNVYVPNVLAKWLRPHQREGVQFMYECVMGLRPFNGQGCILADDMGLGKTLQSVTLIYTLLKTGITKDGLPTCKRVIIVCPCSLVKNWDNEFSKWLGPGTVKTLPLAESDRVSVEKNMDTFVKTKMFNILIVSYETIRMHISRLSKYPDCCDLLVCDEAHRLKNSENQTSKALNSLPVKRRVLLTGTPMQNNLEEFFAMVDFTNPGVLAPSAEDFRRRMLGPILRGREPDATDAQKKRMMEIQNDMSSIVNDFILRRVNTLNAQHLPPKLVQVVCCNLTGVQQNMYQQLVTGKDMKHVLEGKQENCLGYIQLLMKLCNHPSLIVEDDETAKSGRRSTSKAVKYSEENEKPKIEGAQGLSKFLPYAPGKNSFSQVNPEWSGKMFVLYRLMKEMRKPGNGNDKIVIISNYTQTLDLVGKMCRENSWGFCRLDGSVTMKKRQKMVDEFNNPQSSLVAFLLSSKAGGCGINLIGANRLVLFDPDWNPAVDAQAAARCWRDGQKKRCFTYRLLATGTVEEKIFQRQLAKQGLQQVVDDKEQVNALSTKDLRNLFKLRQDTPSDTHDKLRCERCRTISDDAELEAKRVLPKKLAFCRALLERMLEQDDSSFFAIPLVPQDHGVSKEQYELQVKQPIDLGTIKSRLELPQDKPSAYQSVSSFSRDLNRVFANVLKVWKPGQEIADAARRLQSWWVDEWTNSVPVLMSMKSDDKPGSPHVSMGLACEEIFDNERGDNYQEQIGMPDEEDMRCWSHHHTVETVDDPIFRAAMRGFDSVSFVFGLEVTWSLIQLRKQEEEEKQALLELEESRRINLDEESDGGDGDSEMKPSPSTVMESSSDKPGKPTNQIVEDDCQGRVIDFVNEQPVVLVSMGMEKEQADVHTTAVDTVGSDDPELETELDENDASPCSGPSSDQISVQAPKSGQDKSSDKWMCTSCTYYSAASRKTCGMCRKKRDVPMPDQTWQCLTCTFMNSAIKKTCAMCKIRRDSPTKKRRV